MTGRAPQSFRTRTALTGGLALLAWAIFAVALPLADLPAGATIFGLSARAALALPIALPVFVLIMFWFTARQNMDDERFRDDG
jgi:hypothetical protein